MDSSSSRDLDQRAVRDAETYRRVYERAVDAIIIHDRETQQILDANPAALRRYGYTLEQIRSMTPIDLHPPEERDVVRERLEVANPTEPHVYEHLTGDGRRLVVEILSDQVDFDGRPAWLSIVRDISERRRAEQAIADARDEAIHASQKKSDYVSSISHELRTPVNGILGMAALLRETSLTEEQSEYADTIHDATESLLTLLNELLDLSKIEAGKLEVQENPMDLPALCEDVVRLLSARARQSGVELRIDVDGTGNCTLLGDAARLRQVLVNLVGNSLKFTKKGHVEIRLRCTGGSPTRTTVRLEVEDTGIGIPADQLHRVFEPFGQVHDRRNGDLEGTGLGLTISQRLVAMMGGDLQFQSEPGNGTTFWFDLDLARDRSTPAATAPQVDESLPLALVVAPAGAPRDAFVREIQSWDARVAIVDSAGDALEQAEVAARGACPWFAVLIDMQLSDLDGETLGRTLRKRPVLAQLPLVLLPPAGLPVDASRLARSGFVAAAHDPEELRLLRSTLLPRDVAPTEAAEQPAREPESTPSAAAATLAAKSSCGDGADALAAPSILVIEDNPVNQKVVCYMLTRMGFRVDLAEDGAQGVTRFREGAYDLVLMDCQMPVMDGYEATRNIRRIPGERARTPIVALTANAMDGDREKCLAAGMDDYMSKPAKADQLSEMLRRWIPNCQERCEAGTTKSA